jgi:pyridoxal phosphate enzyme (YggS family)
MFQWVHTVDRLKIASRLNDQRPHFSPPLNICIQVNQAGETQKGGVDESEVAELAHAVMSLPRLRLRGLMTLPPATPNPESNAPLFARLNRLKAVLIEEGIPLDTLSMGMSTDFEVAIGQGSTIVRVGTAIFGPRR